VGAGARVKSDEQPTRPAVASRPDVTPGSAPDPAALERRGRRWVLWSFLFCPCHLPLTLTILATLAGSTAAGAVLRTNRLAVGVAVTAIWLVGTARGLLLVRRADRCRVGPRRRPA
jgi:hypothetical protein